MSDRVQAMKDRLGTAKKEEPLKVETKKTETIVTIEMTEDKAKLLAEYLVYARTWSDCGKHGDFAEELYCMLTSEINLDDGPEPEWADVGSVS